MSSGSSLFPEKKINLFETDEEKNQPDIPKMKNGLFQIIRMEESIRLKRVKYIGRLELFRYS